MTSKTNEGFFDHMIKLIIIGDSGVGKTNILMKFCEQGFRDNYIATIGVDFKVKTIQVENKKLKLQIWDTAGQERFRNITQTYYKGALGVVLVYSVTNEASFNNIQRWISQICDSSNRDVRMVLVGNKTDLVSERKVSRELGKNLAQKHDIPFFQCSAKTGYKIEDIFMKLGQEIKRNIDNKNIDLQDKGTSIDYVNTEKKRSCEC